MHEAIDIQAVKKVVIKIGTSTLTTETGRIDHAHLRHLVEQIGWLVGTGRNVIVVTSAAIAAGVEALGLEERPTAIPELQAAASVGQGMLLHEYTRLFAEMGITVGQVLLTQNDVTHRNQYLNARNTLKTLLDLGTVPIVNENDATAVDEIKLGDNDTLASIVANVAEMDLLVLLSDVEGLYTCDPRDGGESCLLSVVEEITPEIEELAGGAGTKFASGGMFTKLQAAKAVTFGGMGMIIADGRRANVIRDLFEGEKLGTAFLPRKRRMASRRLWIAFGKQPTGTVVVDEGARKALVGQGRSLLPAGVTGVKGEFSVGDTVDVEDSEGRVFARGLTNFSSQEVRRIQGLRSSEAAELVPDAESEELIHRDCLVILR
ncbi:MAG: glutamate 5-kinase [Candidatus Aquicultorales bacterium]